VQHPYCGELDIMETARTLNNHNQATPHYRPGNDDLTTRVAFQPKVYHVWEVKIDRTPSDWRNQSISWVLDGKEYYRITGAQVNDQNWWINLAQRPHFIIFNVAVGGYFPGDPDANTRGGTDAMMWVQWVGVFKN
jgi:beta-glucanase (GH16 family)